MNAATPPEVLDLSDTLPQDTAVLEICLPGTAKPTGWIIELAGPGHDKTIAVTDEINRESLEAEKAIRFAQANGRKFKIDDEQVDDRRRKNVSRIVARIVGWSPNPIFKFFSPDAIKFDEKTAIDLFMSPRMSGYFGQIVDFLNSEAGFTKRSAKT